MLLSTMHAFIYTRDVHFRPSQITRHKPGTRMCGLVVLVLSSSNSFWKVADPKDHSTGTPGLS
jgi:hypothetical protein